MLTKAKTGGFMQTFLVSPISVVSFTAQLNGLSICATAIIQWLVLVSMLMVEIQEF